jgi:hypothetical protein
MKTLLFTAAFIGVVSFVNLSNGPVHLPAIKAKAIVCFQDTTPRNSAQQGQYRDLKTGQPLNLNYNQQRRMMYNGATGKPVDFYINGTDTISGSGYIVNNYLMMQPDSSYKLDMGRLRMSNNRYYAIEGGKELQMDRNWPGNRSAMSGNRRDSTGNASRRTDSSGGNRRDSL